MESTVFELVVPVTKIIFEHQKEASTSRFTLRNQTPSVNIGESVFIFFLERRVENDVKNSLSIPGCRERLSLTVSVL